MRSWVSMALLSSAVILAADAGAVENNSKNTASESSVSNNTATKDAESESFGMLYDLSSQMLGHAAMARDAIAFGLYNAASDNIILAQKEASDLAAQTQQFNAQFASRTAKNNNNTAANSDYLFPVMDNTLYMQDINAKRISSSNPRVDIADAEKVNYMLFIDTKQANDALNQAQSDVQQEKYNDALIALNNIGNGAVIAATAYDTPLEAARDNLLLAREMMRNKQYKSASYALKHANYELSRAEKTDISLANNNDTKNLQGQITELQTTLAKENPSLVQRAEAEVDGWIHTIESHLHKRG